MIDYILHKQTDTNKSKNDLLFVCVFDNGPIELALNHLQSLKRSGIQNYMAYATDKRTYAKVKLLGFNVSLIQDLGKLSAHELKKKKEFGREDFTEMSFLRYKIISAQLETHSAVWYMDVDTVVLADLNRYYEHYKDSGYDMVFQDDIHQIQRCTGCVLYFSSDKTIQATAQIYKGMNRNIPDQHYMHYFLEQNPRFKVAMFDPREFPNGLLYFDTRDLIQLDEKFAQIKRNYKGKAPAFVHANWMVGIDNKIAAFKRKGLWLCE